MQTASVYIVHAYSLPNDWLGMPNYQQLLDAALDRAQLTIDRIEEESGADLQGVAWETEVIGAPRRGDRRHRRAPATQTRSSSAPAASAAPARCSAASPTS